MNKAMSKKNYDKTLITRVYKIGIKMLKFKINLIKYRNIYVATYLVQSVPRSLLKLQLTACMVDTEPHQPARIEPSDYLRTTPHSEYDIASCDLLESSKRGPHLGQL